MVDVARPWPSRCGRSRRDKYRADRAWRPEDRCRRWPMSSASPPSGRPSPRTRRLHPRRDPRAPAWRWSTCTPNPDEAGDIVAKAYNLKPEVGAHRGAQPDHQPAPTASLLGARRTSTSAGMKRDDRGPEAGWAPSRATSTWARLIDTPLPAGRHLKKAKLAMSMAAQVTAPCTEAARAGTGRARQRLRTPARRDEAVHRPGGSPMFTPWARSTSTCAKASSSPWSGRPAAASPPCWS